MKFEPERLPDYSDEALLREVRRVVALSKGPTLSVTEFGKLSRVGVTTLRRRFGSWPAALEAVGLAEYYNRPCPVKKSRILARSMSDSEILEEMRKVSRFVERSELHASDLRDHASIGVDAIRRRFGTLKAALRAAGLKETSHGRRYSDEECFENLLQVWTNLGRPPKHREMADPPSVVGPKAYTRRWGTWNRALHAFAERVGADVELSASSVQTVTLSCAERLPDKIRMEERDRRDIRLGLRYAVLKRDDFKCVLCGTSPAICPGVMLHVDHVFPFAKGGKTEVGNLRTLCKECNLAGC